MILQQLYLMVQNAISDEERQDLVEYSLIVLFVVIALVGAMTAFSTGLSTIYVEIVAAIP